MDLYEMITSRRTIRRFKSEPIALEVLDKLVDAARLAPSAANCQPCEYVVVDDPTLAARIFPLVKWAAYIAPAGDPAEDERPAAYILVLIDRKRAIGRGIHDAAAGTMNMIYAAQANGIGACWMGAIERDGLRKLLGIPAELDIDSLLALGYPAESPVVEPMKDSVEYWKDEAGVLHVPKRALVDVLHRNGY